MILVTSIEDKNLPFPASKQLQVTQQLPSPSLDKLAETAREYALNRSSANTQKAYASDWALFSRWCRRKGFDVLIPSAEVVGLYLAASASGDGLVKAAVSTIERRLAAITTTYRSAGTPLRQHLVWEMAYGLGDYLESSLNTALPEYVFCKRCLTQTGDGTLSKINRLQNLL